MSETPDTTPAPGTPVPPIGKGDTGTAAGNLLDVLRYWGWAPALDRDVDPDTDWKIDAKAVTAIRKAQTQLGVDPSGSWDDATATAYALMVVELTVAAGAAPAEVDADGSSDDVRTLQAWLAERGYLTDIEYKPGSYDLGTEWAVQRLQRKARTMGLDAGPIDGKYGTLTRAAACMLHG